MKKYLLPESGNFYKANLHCHTTVSDGNWTPEEVKKNYMAMGYSVIAYTDHDVLIPHPELADENFLPLNSYEMEVNAPGPWNKFAKCCHMCLIALEPDNLTQVCWHRNKYTWGNAKNIYSSQVKFDENEPDYERVYSPEGISDMMKRGRDAGFFVTYNHPGWSLESYPEYIGYNNMHIGMYLASDKRRCDPIGFPIIYFNENIAGSKIASLTRLYIGDDLYPVRLVKDYE